MIRTLLQPPTTGRNRILRLTVTNWMLGAALGAACAALFLWFDIGGLLGLMWRPDRVVWQGLVLLFGGFAVTFGSVVCAAAVMTIPAADEDLGRSRGVRVGEARMARFDPEAQRVPVAETRERMVQ